MTKFKKILIVLLVVFALITLSLVNDRASNKLTIRNESSTMYYYIPSILVESQEDVFLLVGAYERPYSFRHLRFDHWWVSTFGLYFVLENDDISGSIVCFEDYALEKVCYTPSQISAEVSSREIRNLYIKVETELGEISISVKKVNFVEATSSTKISDDYEELKVN